MNFLSRSKKAQKREIRDALDEIRAVKDYKDIYFLHDMKREKRNLVDVKRNNKDRREETCGDTDSVSLLVSSRFIPTLGVSIR